MENKKFLNWIADRLVNVYGESSNVDFVLKFREIANEKLLIGRFTDNKGNLTYIGMDISGNLEFKTRTSEDALSLIQSIGQLPKNDKIK